MSEIDELAKEKAIKLGMPPDVHIPIGAKNIESVIRYIGPVKGIESVNEENAFIVTPDFTPELNKKLPLWELRESSVLHCKKQVWVHVDYKYYRLAYKLACPEENITGYVIDHILNRRVARLKGFHYLRIIPVSRGVNTNSGAVTEKYGYNYHSSDRMKNINHLVQPFIEYADIADLVKMLNQKTGGKFQDNIRGAIFLLEEI